MQSSTKRRGRPRLNDSETKLRTYKISQRDYEAFCSWCRSRNLRPTQVIRSLILDYYVKGLLESTKIKSLKELKELKEK